MYTTPILNTLVCLHRWMYGKYPTHSQLVHLHRKLRKS